VSAGRALQGGAIAALAAVEELNGAYPGRPIQGALPFATAEVGSEADWSHKSGRGREVRLLVTLRDGGEGPERVQALAEAAEAAMGAIGPAIGGWRVVSLRFLRCRLAQERERWAAVLEYRARMLEM